MTFNRFSNVIAGVKRGAVQGFDEAYLIFINHRGVEKPNGKQAGLDIRATFKRRGLIENAICPGRKDVHLGTSLSAGRDKQFSILKTEMPGNGFSQQPARIKRGAISGDDHADFTLGNDRSLGDRNAEQVRMNRPQAWRQRSQLNAFDAALFDERNRILKIVMRVLRAIQRENSSRQHRLAVNRLNDTELIGANLDQRNFAHDFLKRKSDQMQAGL